MMDVDKPFEYNVLPKMDFFDSIRQSIESYGSSKSNASDIGRSIMDPQRDAAMPAAARLWPGIGRQSFPRYIGQVSPWYVAVVLVCL
jgi:hypothetical protein